ncbi:MAG: phosphatidylinositol-specific phospholipase C1-like protein [Terracidiphilus sp.]|nr:phosphatidylinositol-specific phospholipase C1-like protein [Terracidiphilus sp.]
MRICITIVLYSVAASAICGNTQQHDSSKVHEQDLQINQLQYIGTHNSYHAGLAPSIAKVLQQKAPDVYTTLDYIHPDLSAQFDEGVRQIELDVYADAKGGRYAHPIGPQIAEKMGIPHDSLAETGPEMLRPGFKVMHIQDIDFRSTCQPFTACLREVRDWSEKHPQHLPIFILIETKEEVETKEIPMTVPEPYTVDALNALEDEILSVFRPDQIITPDSVRGHYATLENAILHHGWPSVSSSRGKIMFMFLNENIRKNYLTGHPSLRGRTLFTNAKPGQADAAFIDRSGEDMSDVASLVKRGYMVRVRADADTIEARKNDYHRCNIAFQSGAQFISTDYPVNEPARWTGYTVSFAGDMVARVNPVSASEPLPAESR